MSQINVHASKDYCIKIEPGIFDTCGLEISNLIASQKCAIISDDTVDMLYGARIETSLNKAGFNTCKFVFPHGEESKNATNYIKILEFLANNKLTRSDTIIACGGGVVGDLAGFAAASYLRGINFIQIPTTLLAMVDSSVGGKTAIDLSAGKNLAGAFYQPNLVLCDPCTLDTLPAQIFSDGCAEVIKYGILQDSEILQLIQNSHKNIKEIITRCISIKRDIVEKDEHEAGLRKTLNLGHTVAHALEKLSDYKLSHGCAVGIGLAVIARAAYSNGDCSQDCADKIISSLQHVNLPTETDFELQDIICAMKADKKISGDSITIIVPREIGTCELRTIPFEELGNYIKQGL